jgi:hypothetical protein
MACCACGANRSLPLLTFGQVPISGIYLEKADDVLQRYDIKLSYCDGCGLTSRDRITTPMHDYSRIDRGTAQQMPDYADDIVTSLREAGLSANASILEVGSNDGRPKMAFGRSRALSHRSILPTKPRLRVSRSTMPTAAQPMRRSLWPATVSSKRLSADIR